MSGVNKKIILGRLGKDPKTGTTKSGKPYALFSIATSQKWTDKQTGEVQEKTTWHNCQAWNRLAELVSKYLNKGSQVYLEGYTENQENESDGTKYYRDIMIIQTMQFVGSKSDNQSNGKSSEPDEPPFAGDSDDDDLPF